MAERPWFLQGSIQGKDIHQELGDSVVVLGRSPHCDIVVGDASVSRRHAEIRPESGGFLLCDLGSRNGTRLNGRTLQSAAMLRPHDRIGLAAVELVVGGGPVQDADITQLTLTNTSPPTGAELSWLESRGLERQRTDRRGQLFRVLVQAGEMLVAARSPEELYEPVLDLVESAFAPERALFLCAQDEGEPTVAAVRMAKGQAGGDVALSRTVVRRVLTEKVSLLIEDLDLGGLAQLMQSIVAQGVRAGMAVPLVDEGRVMGLLYADTTAHSVRYTRDDLKAFTLLSGVVGTAFTHARYHALEEEQQRLQTELNAARNILATIIPEQLPEVAGWELRAYLESCFEVGGDLYDLQSLPDGRLLVVAGDVAGKGLGAALLVSSIVPMLRTLAETEPDPLALVTRLNRHIWRTTDSVRYATLFVGLLDPQVGRFVYVNAGHNPPYVLAPGGRLRSLASTGMPVGMLEEAPLAMAETVLEPGELLVLYSDGISEAAKGDEFYGEGRFEAMLGQQGGKTADAVLAAALADLGEHVGDADPEDDVTLVLLRRT